MTRYKAEKRERYLHEKQLTNQLYEDETSNHAYGGTGRQRNKNYGAGNNQRSGQNQKNQAGGDGDQDMNKDENNKYPDLEEILYIDDIDESYDVPFSNPDELMAIFSELEDKNLSLIQQGQEAEQQIENKKKEMIQIEETKERELSELKKTENENTVRTRRVL